jgi:hypothetical protein
VVNQDQKLESLLSLFEHTQLILEKYAVRSINSALVVRNWLFGLYLVEFENAGGSRSELYGVKLLSTLSKTTSVPENRTFY